MSKNLRQSFMATAAAVIWGFAFVAQSVSTDIMEPFFFLAARSVLACVFLFVLLLVRKESPRHEKGYMKSLIIGGGLSGLALAAASWLQQAGIAYTQAGKAGFLTALYIVIVPLLRLFGGKRATLRTWLSVIFAVAGFALLCLNGDLGVGKGEILVILSAFVFALQIVIIDKYSAGLDSVEMSLVQFITVAVISLAGTLLFESTPVSTLSVGILPVLYAGIMSSGVAYTLQIAAQKNCGDPVRISLLLSLESVFSVVGGAILLREMLTLREFAGCAVIFAAAVIAQLPSKTERKAV